MKLINRAKSKLKTFVHQWTLLKDNLSYCLCETLGGGESLDKRDMCCKRDTVEMNYRR